MLSARFAVNPAGIKLCVIRKPHMTILQLRVDRGLLHDGFCRSDAAAFVCTQYHDTVRSHYTAPDWLERLRRYGFQMDDEDDPMTDEARIQRNEEAKQFNAWLAGTVANEGQLRHMDVVRDPSNGIFSERHKLGMCVHSFAVEPDSTGYGTTLTVAVPLRIVLCLLVQIKIRDNGDTRIKETEFSSLRLEFVSV